MAGTRQILQRRKAVANIAKVTRTMEMISTSRYKNYYNRWFAGLDFYDSLAQAAYLLLTSSVPVEHPLMKENNSGRIAVLAIGSNRGLCGSYNNSVYRLLEVHLQRAKRAKKQIDIYACGRKLVNTLHYHNIPIKQVYSDFDEVPSEAQSHAMADGFIEQYEKGELDYLGIVYTRFYSRASQHPQTLTVLPVAELIDDLTTRATVIWPSELSFEDFYMSPSAEGIFGSVVRMMVRSSLRNCFVEAALSEHLARVVAMRNATENAGEMIKELTAEYNRARQGQITGELLDIIGGVGASK
ncbi:MAG: ATP synthase F1 subunit gamma [Planctomycetes bacterium GWF2_50_10]|nr:MAG: ATP synthase F1 subunit gamma [Planctomycetes bacterium GWF2_50_10]